MYNKTFRIIYHSFLGLVLLTTTAFSAIAQTGTQYLEKMYQQNASNWYRTLSFTQDTEIYRNDSIVRRSVWYERARFPYELRIDVDSISGGNKVLYKKDSTYRIRNGRIVTVTKDPNPFIFFLGGMYMLPLDSVKNILQWEGYDLSLGSTTSWQGRKTIIIGAGNDSDPSRNQFWIDAEHQYVVRVMLKMGNASMDVHLSGQQKLTKGWSETLVQFYRDGKLLQAEHYRNIVADVKMGEEVFDVERYRN